MTEAEAQTETETETQRLSLRSRVAGAVAVVLLLTCLGLAAWGQLWLHQQRADDARRTDVLAAAEDGTAQVLSYDYRRLSAGAKRTSALLTGNALSQYRGVQAPLVKAAPGLKAVVSAEVKAATVLNASGSSARVLLFVDQTSTSTKLKAPQVDQSRVVVALVHRHGSWLISSIAAV